MKVFSVYQCGNKVHVDYSTKNSTFVETAFFDDPDHAMKFANDNGWNNGLEDLDWDNHLDFLAGEQKGE